MEILQGLLHGFSVIAEPQNLFYCFLGCLIGTLVGVLPGVGPLAALSVLLPVTFALPPVGAVAMLAGIFYGAMYGGSTTSILVNIPGEAASVVTCLDGHALARQGRAGAALGMAAIGSFVAGTLSVVGLTLFSPLLTSVALKFGPPENFAVIALGFVATVFMVQGSAAKGFIVMALGVLFACIGIDQVNGKERFTFGFVNLTNGFDLVPVVIGLFGISEILMNLEQSETRKAITDKIKGLLPTFADWKASWKPILRGSGLGFGLGVLPGGNPVTASFVSYALERRLAKEPGRFGKGAIEGVAGPEAANNSAVGGGMIPLLSLGLPSNAVTALLLGALVIQNVTPGPLLAAQYPDVFWGVIASMYIGNVMLLILNLPLIGLWVQLLRVPYRILFPLVLLLSVVGAYSANKNVFDLWIMLGFGVGGYLLRKMKYELAPFAFAMVLAPQLEQALRQSLIMSRNNPMIFLERPIAAGLLFVVLVLIVALIVGLRPKTAGSETDA
jgi:putative tricarboxylic transport membrane protein